MRTPSRNRRRHLIQATISLCMLSGTALCGCRVHRQTAETAVTAADSTATVHFTQRAAVTDSLVRQLTVSFDTVDVTVERHTPAGASALHLRGVKARAATHLATRTTATDTTSVATAVTSARHHTSSASTSTDTATAASPLPAIITLCLICLICLICLTLLTLFRHSHKP